MFKITPIPAFDDNYIWAIYSDDGKHVAVVDPGDASPVEAFLVKENLELSAILVTHHHGDHTGGIADLTASRTIPVYGPENSPYKGVTQPLQHGDSIALFGHTLAVAEVPGHTLDHISYFSAGTSEGDTPQLFCGDTLFLAGCGRLFEGSAAQMLEAMNYFAALPDSTEVYCTHEYSLANLRFAAAVEPDNQEIQSTIVRCEGLRENDKPTLPSSLGVEKQINPFMRSDAESVAKSAAHFSGKTLGSQVEVFAAIREWKNQF